MTTKHPAENERGRFDELAERASDFTSSPAAIPQKFDAVGAALFEQRRGSDTAAPDDLAEAIGLHDEI